MTRISFLFTLWLCAWGTVGIARAEGVSVWAAASLKTVMEAAATKLDYPVEFVFAGTPTLARQIQAGAPADVFIAAHPDWTERLVQTNVVARTDVHPVFSNRLVLIARDAKITEFDADILATTLQEGPFAIAIVRAVPSGVYGKQALETLGLWSVVKDNLAQTQNVRQALALVARGEAPIGLVYASDAVASKDVALVGILPETAHDPIVYSAAQISMSSRAAAFMDYLKSEGFQSLVQAHGFKALEQ